MRGVLAALVATCMACTTATAEVIAPKGQIQTWITPQTGVYRISAYGGNGGSAHSVFDSTRVFGGRGAFVCGDFYLDAGSSLSILIAGSALNGREPGIAGGGGGGTFVVLDGATPRPLVVAGGGGGASGRDPRRGGDGLAGTDGGGANGGTMGWGGGTLAFISGGGGGFFGDGGGGEYGGLSFLNGGWPGGPAVGPGTLGGFGGGGAGIVGGGGGGGYSGGGGDSISDVAGGGGSYLDPFALNPQILAGANADISDLTYAAGGQLDITLVPSPGTLGAFGLVVLAYRRRRCRPRP